jgi:hypothetical protein
MTSSLEGHFENFKSPDLERCKIIPIKRCNEECREDEINTPLRVDVIDTKFQSPVYFIAVALLYIMIYAGLYLMIFWKWVRAIIIRYQSRAMKSPRKYFRLVVGCLLYSFFFFSYMSLQI